MPEWGRTRVRLPGFWATWWPILDLRVRRWHVWKHRPRGNQSETDKCRRCTATNSNCDRQMDVGGEAAEGLGFYVKSEPSLVTVASFESVSPSTTTIPLGKNKKHRCIAEILNADGGTLKVHCTVGSRRRRVETRAKLTRIGFETFLNAIENEICIF